MRKTPESTAEAEMGFLVTLQKQNISKYFWSKKISYYT